MNPIQTLRTNSAKANDLFTRIAGTTPGATKTRQTLFAELKAELELNATLERDHLLPVLRKHPETKEMATQITERLRNLRTSLARIEKEPVDGDDFPAKILELKRLFQQHVRDEKNDLLPAIQKALSDDEAADLSAKIAADQAAAAEARQAEDDRRRADAKAERERLAAQQATADKAKQDADDRRRAEAKAERDRLAAKQAAADKAEQEADDRRRAEAKAERDRLAAKQAAEQAREAALLVEKKAEQKAARAARAAAKAQQAQADLASRDLEESVRSTAEVVELPVSQALVFSRQAAQASQLAAGGMVRQMGESLRQYSAAWSGYARNRLNNRVSAWGALGQCRTPGDLFAVQAKLVRDEVENLRATGEQLSGIAGRATMGTSATRRG